MEVKVTVNVRKTTTKEKLESIIGIALIIGFIYFVRNR